MIWFERALELAERGRDKVEDHPLVGAVLVHGDQVVGEGWYEYAGVQHAEVIALAQAGDAREAPRCTSRSSRAITPVARRPAPRR